MLKLALMSWIQPCIHHPRCFRPSPPPEAMYPLQVLRPSSKGLSLSCARETTRGSERSIAALSQRHVGDRHLETAEVVHSHRPGRLQPLSTEVVLPRRGLQASPRVESLSGGPPPGQLPTFYRKSIYRLTCRPGANVCKHTRMLIL